MVRAFVRSARLLKTEKSGLLAFAQKKLGLAEKFWKKLIRSWSTRFQPMVSSKTVVQSAIGHSHPAGEPHRLCRLWFSPRSIKEINAELDYSQFR
jgi:hypothetical protein